MVTWDNSLKQRFTDVVPWIADAGPGGWNNLDSLDVGVGSMDGLSNDERQTYMTLWAIEAAPLYSGPISVFFSKRYDVPYNWALAHSW